MKLTDLEGEKALEVLADLLDPASEIFSDPDVVAVIRGTDQKLKWTQAMLRKQPKAIIKILAILDEQDPETYKVNLLTLPVKVLNLLNSPEMASLFPSQGQTKENASSGSALENIEA